MTPLLIAIAATLILAIVWWTTSKSLLKKAIPYIKNGSQRRSHTERPHELKMRIAEKEERSREVKGAPEFEDEFQPIVEMARDRFPDFHCWGQYIHNGKGYGVFVTNGIKKSMFQVKSEITVQGKTGKKVIDNDIRKATSPKTAISQAFDAMEKSLNDGGARG